MVLNLTDVRCPTPDCGAPLATSVTLTAGWIERRCDRCGRVTHLGDTAHAPVVVKVRCRSHTAFSHTLALASRDWRGTVGLYCRKCRSLNTITAH